MNQKDKSRNHNLYLTPPGSRLLKALCAIEGRKQSEQVEVALMEYAIKHHPGLVKTLNEVKA